ncbi:MAG TPA: integrase family protein, partial [Rhizomicrobium sp.]|nr:integrase family protein [Rhizomicrobium sp.]
MPSTKLHSLADDDQIKALIKLTREARGFGSIYADGKGLQLRIGKRRIAWIYYAQRMTRGQRSTTQKLLGQWPSMKTVQARREADKVGGRVSSGRQEPGRKSATKFAEAFERYVLHLRKKSADKGKPATWAHIVEGKGKKHLLPQWGRWTLAEMSGDPLAIHDWHARMTVEHGPVAANSAARVVRAVYRHAARLSRGLPPALPTSGVDFNKEQAREITAKELRSWAAMWRKIDNENRRAFHLLCLLTGCRPGELGRLKWSDVRPRERLLIIPTAKAGIDIRVPMSAPVARALVMARESVTGANEFVFPARGSKGHIVRFDSDGLPFYANALRHVYRTLATECGVDDTLAHLLLGHAPRG